MRTAKAGNYLIAVAGIAELNHCFRSRYDYLGTVPVVGQISHVTFVLGGNLNAQTRPPLVGSCLREGGLGVFSLAVLGPRAPFGAFHPRWPWGFGLPSLVLDHLRFLTTTLTTKVMDITRRMRTWPELGTSKTLTPRTTLDISGHYLSELSRR